MFGRLVQVLRGVALLCLCALLMPAMPTADAYFDILTNEGGQRCSGMYGNDSVAGYNRNGSIAITFEGMKPPISVALMIYEYQDEPLLLSHGSFSICTLAAIANGECDRAHFHRFITPGINDTANQVINEVLNFHDAHDPKLDPSMFLINYPVSRKGFYCVLTFPFDRVYDPLLPDTTSTATPTATSTASTSTTASDGQASPTSAPSGGASDTSSTTTTTTTTTTATTTTTTTTTAPAVAAAMRAARAAETDPAAALAAALGTPPAPFRAVPPLERGDASPPLTAAPTAAAAAPTAMSVVTTIDTATGQSIRIGLNEMSQAAQDAAAIAPPANARADAAGWNRRVPVAAPGLTQTQARPWRARRADAAPDDSPAELGYSEIDIQFINPFGHLSGINWPKLKFYGALMVVYIVLGGLWGWKAYRAGSDVLPLQLYVAAAFVILAAEMGVTFGYYVFYNGHGTYSITLLAFVAILNSLRSAASFFLLLIVSLGYGVVRPTLGPAMRKCQLAGIAHFLSGLLYVCGSFLLDSTSDISWVLALLFSLPIGATMTFIYSWTLWGLQDTTATLTHRRQHIKLRMYQRLKQILLVAALLFVWAYVATAVRLTQYQDRDWEAEHWEIIWWYPMGWSNALYLVVFCSICVLWRPTDNNRRYGLQELASEDFGDDMDDMDGAMDVGFDDDGNPIGAHDLQDMGAREEDLRAAGYGRADDDYEYDEPGQGIGGTSPPKGGYGHADPASDATGLPSAAPLSASSAASPTGKTAGASVPSAVSASGGDSFMASMSGGAAPAKTTVLATSSNAAGAGAVPKLPQPPSSGAHRSPSIKPAIAAGASPKIAVAVLPSVRASQDMPSPRMDFGSDFGSYAFHEGQPAASASPGSPGRQAVPAADGLSEDILEWAERDLRNEPL